MAEQYPLTFGKYELLEKIAGGGMAEVFRARTFGLEGFQKPVAIKRILPHLSTQSDFIAMLADEAKTVVRLTHANIVEVYDFGKVDDSYYLAMEFIDGIDLATLLRSCHEQKRAIPPEIAAWIVRDVCRGLAYAHGRRDEDGTHLGIVHRDISPANILIARTGEVKLTDFGIAKAASNIYATDIGVLKGKIAYMSPEQAAGEEPDKRSDLFSLGLVLLELVTGNRFFTGESQTTLLRKVKEIQIAEADIPGTLPIGLRKILTRALAHDPRNRYQTAEELEEALTIFCVGIAANFTAARVANFINPFLPSEPLWKPFAALTSLVPSAYKPAATEVMKKTTKIKKPLGWLLMFSGISGDIIKPILASFSWALCLISAAGAAGAFVALRRKFRHTPLTQILDARLGMISLFLSASFVIWGVIALVQFATPARGVIASVAPPIASLQDTLANIAGKVAVIETTTTEISKDVKDIKQAIEALGNSEGLIAKPKTPQEFYHNARVYQLRGMNQQAIDAYKRFLELAPDFIDGHLVLQLLTRDSPGSAPLDGWYATLASKHPENRSVRLMRVRLLADRVARIAELEKLHTGFPDFAPVALSLAREYFDQGWVGKTRRYLTTLDGLFADVAKSLDQQQFQSLFVDKAALELELEPMRAWQRYAQSMATEWAKPLITIEASETDQGLALGFFVADQGVRKILYSIDDPTPKIETGFIPGQTNPLTNTPEPQIQVMGTILEGRHTIYAQYIDRDGHPSEIFQLQYESRPFRVRTLMRTGQLGSPKVDLDVTFMPKEGKAFAKYRYSVDQPHLDQSASGDRALLQDVPFGSHILYVKGIDPSGKETAMFEVPFATE